MTSGDEHQTSFLPLLTPFVFLALPGRSARQERYSGFGNVMLTQASLGLADSAIRRQEKAQK